MKKKPSVIAIIVILVLATAAITGALIFRKSYGQAPENDEITDELSDEFTRIKWFITDWYNELKASGKCGVYLNELRFESGKYTLTFANGRIRAVYPRGERFFKLEQVNKIEFFTTNDILRCRLCYGGSGEYLFRING